MLENAYLYRIHCRNHYLDTILCNTAIFKFIYTNDHKKLSVKFLSCTLTAIEKVGFLLFFLFLARTTIKIRLNSDNYLHVYRQNPANLIGWVMEHGPSIHFRTDRPPLTIVKTQVSHPV